MSIICMESFHLIRCGEMNVYSKVLVCFTLCGALLLSGCDKNDGESSRITEIVVSDFPSDTENNDFPINLCGEKIEKAVEKAVSLSPAATEIICELGLEDKLVGTSSYCDYPDGLSLPRLGSSENPDIDGIIMLAPDAVFTVSALAERDSYVLEQAGIAVIKLGIPVSIDGYAELYSDISAAFYGNAYDGGIKKAEKIGEEAKEKLCHASEKVRLGSFLYITEKFTAAGTNTFESAVLSLSGGNLCVKDGYISVEELKDIQPDSLIIDNKLNEDDIMGNEFLSKLAENSSVYYVDRQFFERPSYRTVKVFEQIRVSEML